MTDLTTGQICALLGATSALVESECLALGDAEASWHPAPGEWCVKECVGHLIETDRRGFVSRIRTLIDQERAEWISSDPDAVARERADCARPLGGLVREFLEGRRVGIETVRWLQPEHLQRSGIHPRAGEVTVRELLHKWVHHDRNHARQLLAVVQARVWPSMGATQRFRARPEEGRS